jgi:hypothetical protein
VSSLRTVAILVGTVGFVVGLAVTGACITAPPPDLPPLPAHRPTILRGSVVPPPDTPLVQWPVDKTFLVPVELYDPNQTFWYDVFVDYDPVNNTSPKVYPQPVVPNAATMDGGVFLVSFGLNAPDDPGPLCHRIEVLVAHEFNKFSPHTPDSVGGDSVSWLYTAGGGPDGCPEYDAGALQGGAFPDAATDGLPIPVGGDP